MKQSFPLEWNGCFFPACCFGIHYYANTGALAVTICRRIPGGTVPLAPLTINLGPVGKACIAIQDTAPGNPLLKQMERIGLVRRQRTTVTIGSRSFPICEINERILTQYAA